MVTKPTQLSRAKSVVVGAVLWEGCRGYWHGFAGGAKMDALFLPHLESQLNRRTRPQSPPEAGCPRLTWLPDPSMAACSDGAL